MGGCLDEEGKKPGMETKNTALAGRTGGFERPMQEADSAFQESLHQEQKGDCAAALALCNEAICKYLLTASAYSVLYSLLISINIT